VTNDNECKRANWCYARPRMRTLALLAACCALLTGCPKGGDNTDEESGSGSSPGSGDPCDEWKAWKLRCEPDAGSGDLAYYDKCRTMHWDRVKPEFTEATADCFPTLSCDSSDDACSAMGYAAAGVTDQSVEGDALVQDCVMTIAGCNMGDDLCIDLSVLIDSARAQAQRCTGLGCDAAKGCLREVFGGSPEAAH
jgi:hypothetical protein